MVPGIIANGIIKGSVTNSSKGRLRRTVALVFVGTDVLVGSSATMRGPRKHSAFEFGAGMGPVRDLTGPAAREDIACGAGDHANDVLIREGPALGVGRNPLILATLVNAEGRSEGAASTGYREPAVPKSPAASRAGAASCIPAK